MKYVYTVKNARLITRLFVVGSSGTVQNWFAGHAVGMSFYSYLELTAKPGIDVGTYHPCLVLLLVLPQLLLALQVLQVHSGLVKVHRGIRSLLSRVGEVGESMGHRVTSVRGFQARQVRGVP